MRVIASTTRNLTEKIANGKFREDLYYRLCVVPIVVPALKTRPEDISLLVKHFVDVAVTASGLSKRKISNDAMACLESYDWPGNVRELRNLIERIAILQPDTKDKISNIIKESLKIDNFDDQIAENSLSVPLKEAREKFEKEYLTIQLKKFNGNISKTANFVGMERSALHRKLKGLGIKEFN